MKTLSAANQANIIQAHQDPDLLVEFTGLSLKYSMQDRDGYEIGLISVSDIEMSYDPYEGLAHWSDCTVQIAAKHGSGLTEIIEEHEFTNEAMKIVVKYGSDADIDVWTGTVDTWTYAEGVITIHGIANSSLRGLSLPTQQITEANFSSYSVPAQSINKWVPFTIGQPYIPKGYIINHGDGTQVQAIFNANVTGHDGIGEFTTGTASVYIYSQGQDDVAGDFGGHALTTDVAKGELKFADADEFSFLFLILPVYAESDPAGAFVAWTNPLNAIDLNAATYAELTDPAAGPGGTATGVLLMRLGEVRWGSEFKIKNMYIVANIAKNIAKNSGGRTLEEFHGAIQVVEGTNESGTQLLEI